MSEINEEFREFLFKNFPLETIFISEITKQVNDLYQKLPTHPNFTAGQIKDMKFQVIKRPETDYAEIQLSMDSMLFLGAMAKAISNVFVSDVLPNVILQTKACSNCNSKNVLKAKYCLECGEPFN